MIHSIVSSLITIQLYDKFKMKYSKHEPYILSDAGNRTTINLLFLQKVALNRQVGYLI